MSLELVKEEREDAKATTKTKWRIPVIVTEIVVLIAVVVGGILLAIHNGFFLSDKDKVILALKNTLTESKDVEKFLSNAGSILQSPEYSISFESEREGDATFMEYGYTTDGKQLHLETELGGIFDMEITAFVDKNQIQMMHSDAKNVVLVYQYAGENNGYLFRNVLPKEQIKEVNANIASIYELGENPLNNSTDVETIAKAYSELKFEQTDEKSFEIDGVNVRCQGYQTVLEEDITGIISAEKGAEVTFYIDNELLAGIVIESPDKEIEISFLGGDYRLQNIAICEDKNPIIELEIGDLEIDASEVELEGKAKIDWERLGEIDSTGALKLLHYAKADGSLSSKWSDINIVMSDGVDLEKFEGTSIDVGNASLLEMAKSMMELLMEYFGEWL